jgi:hypothetical protein
MSQDAQEWLIRQGWARVDASGPFSGHRYVAADQIALVSDGEVWLSVTEEQLFRRAPGDRLP